MRTIEVVVQTDGQVNIDAKGFHGADCEKATAFIENALGTAVNRVKKPEYHSRARTRARQRLGR